MVLVGYVDDVVMVTVTATIEELEWKCNEALEIVSQWMKEHGLKLDQEKSEAILVTKRKKFEYPKLVLDGHTIQFQDSIPVPRPMDRQELELQRPHQANIDKSRECGHSSTTSDAQCRRT